AQYVIGICGAFKRMAPMRAPCRRCPLWIENVDTTASHRFLNGRDHESLPERWRTRHDSNWARAFRLGQRDAGVRPPRTPIWPQELRRPIQDRIVARANQQWSPRYSKLDASLFRGKDTV